MGWWSRWPWRIIGGGTFGSRTRESAGAGVGAGCDAILVAVSVRAVARGGPKRDTEIRLIGGSTDNRDNNMRSPSTIGVVVHGGVRSASWHGAPSCSCPRR